MLKNVKTRNHLKPGMKGTKRLMEKYGDSLLCVRYRYDARRGVKLKTVELIVEEKALQATLPCHDEDIVDVLVRYSEKSLREKLKSAGGKWDPESKLWHVSYGAIRGTELVDRILLD
jgi:hypothetical protein